MWESQAKNIQYSPVNNIIASILKIMLATGQNLVTMNRNY